CSKPVAFLGWVLPQLIRVLCGPPLRGPVGGARPRWDELHCQILKQESAQAANEHDSMPAY
ncbi:hypothetical protein V5799_011607, partial [Amblyomma americanum]